MNFEEQIYGIAYGLVSFFAVGLWCIPAAICTSFLYAMGGMNESLGGGKFYRRIIMPAIMCLLFAIAHRSLVPLVSFPFQWLALSIGYGEVDVNDPTGSWLGRHFGRWTRVVWLLILAITMIPLFIK